MVLHVNAACSFNDSYLHIRHHCSPLYAKYGIVAAAALRGLSCVMGRMDTVCDCAVRFCPWQAELVASMAVLVLG